MSDPLMLFLMSRDRDRVLAEGRSTFERMYRDAPVDVRAAIDETPIAELRRKLENAEAARDVLEVQLEAARRDRKTRVQVVGNRELAQMLARERQRTAELQEIIEEQARMIAGLREQKEAA